MIYTFNFKKKNQPTLNDYDWTLKLLLEDSYHQSTLKDLKSYVIKIYFRQQALPVYPQGEEYNSALNRIKSNQQCLQYAIEEYDEWYSKVTNYIDENMDKFEFYKGYKTGDRNYPPMSYEIIDDTVRYDCILRRGMGVQSPQNI